jgi:hypothetical protein
MADSAQNLDTIFGVVQEYLSFIGLKVSIKKCSVLVVGGKPKEAVLLGNEVLQSVGELRFLGLKIDTRGHF